MGNFIDFNVRKIERFEITWKLEINTTRGICARLTGDNTWLRNASRGRV